MTQQICAHPIVSCINPYELIRKYRCGDCSGLMMCACDEADGRRFLAHQLDRGAVLETQERVPVTHGFEPNICARCRGLPIVATPVAAMHGATSKIKRYYWRELFFEGMRGKADWDAAHPQTDEPTRHRAHEAIEAAVLEAIKHQHAKAPTYTMDEPSQAQILERCGVIPISLTAPHVEGGKKGAVILDAGETISPEEYVARRYRAEGWSVMTLESLPFHALFGVMTYLLIQSPGDPLGRFVQFGDRNDFEAKRSCRMIATTLPSDFGSAGYGQRRSGAIAKHVSTLEDGQLLWLFDYWRGYSEDFRQYLWAHKEADVDRARRLIEILAPDVIRTILRYLIESYWDRYLGWPDLLLHRGDEIRMVEVKSSSDKLSQDQKRWIQDNHDRLKIPFDLVKIHRPSAQAKPTVSAAKEPSA